MEIIKAFNSNDLHTNIVIKGTYNEPLFRASDIREILEISNIRTSIQNFNETERHVHTMNTSLNFCHRYINLSLIYAVPINRKYRTSK